MISALRKKRKEFGFMNLFFSGNGRCFSPFMFRSLIALALALSLASAPALAGDDVYTISPDDEKHLLKQADKLARNGEYTEAEKIYRRVIKTNPDNARAKVSLAHTLVKQRQLVEAYDLSLGVARSDPENAYAYSVLGTTLLAAGRFEDARGVLYTAIKKNRKEALAWAGFGLLEFFENNIDESLMNLKEAVYHDPNEPDYVFAMAQVSARAERYREAADAYNRYLRIANQTDKERRDRIRGLIEFLRFLGNRSSLYSASGPESTTINFTLTGNRPVLELKINGRDEPLKFVLDTGSGITVISEETAERLKIREITRGGYAKGIGGDGKFEIVYGFLREVDLNGIRIRSVPTYIRRFHNTSNQVDGYIGLSLISKFLTTVDYGKETFTLVRKDGLKKADGHKDAITVPLRLTSSGFLSGEVLLTGVENPLNFIVDTGASISVISDDVASLEPVSAFDRGIPMRVIGAAGITEDVPSYMIPKVSFGSHSRESIAAIALDLDMINEVAGFEQAGILGGNFLRNYRMTFDFENSVVTFVPIEQKP
jgi:thioredoxin-like negative regulator of GroEL/predicted aspartyl protease